MLVYTISIVGALSAFALADNLGPTPAPLALAKRQSDCAATCTSISNAYESCRNGPSAAPVSGNPRGSCLCRPEFFNSIQDCRICEGQPGANVPASLTSAIESDYDFFFDFCDRGSSLPPSSESGVSVPSTSSSISITALPSSSSRSSSVTSSSSTITSIVTRSTTMTMTTCTATPGSPCYNPPAPVPAPPAGCTTCYVPQPGCTTDCAQYTTLYSPPQAPNSKAVALSDKLTLTAVTMVLATLAVCLLA